MSMAPERISGSGGQGGPLVRVLQALEAGAVGRRAIARATGLPEGTVTAALGQLERLGRATREAPGAACASGGCGSCPITAGCGGTPDRGPILIALQRRPPGGAVPVDGAVQIRGDAGARTSE